MADYDLAYKKVSELTEDTSAPAAGDWLVRHDSSADGVKKVDATDLAAILGVTATAAELNNAADVSTRLISIADATNTLSLTQATHANRVCLVLDATLAVTLPEATGTGDSYTIMQGIAATSSTIVTADTANAGFHGFIMGSDTDAAGNYNWVATGAQDTITFDGTATGGKIYDWIKVTDVATDAWLLEGNIKQSGGSEVTPLSSAA